MTGPRRPRLVVVASSSLDAVTFAGGWIFDRVMIGWQATVVTMGCTDFRPMRILGSDVADLESVLGEGRMTPTPQAMIIDGRLYRSDARVRAMADGTMADGLDQIMLWNDGTPANRMQHRLSVAALAFKAQALVAVGAPAEPVETSETFHRSVPRPANR
jgi:hypothetical protein